MNITRTRRTTRHASGFSVVEALIAAAILLLVAIGVLPLFVRAMVSNVSGSESSRVSNFAKSESESFAQLPFDSPDLAIGGPTSTYWEDPSAATDGDEAWVTTPTTPSRVSWRRSVTIRQYAAQAFDDGVLSPSEALPAGTPTEFVHFKEIEVVVDPVRWDGSAYVSRAGGVLNPSPSITTRYLKSQ